MALSPGTAVVLQGLAGHASLNNCEGTICGSMRHDERWPVQLSEGRPVLVRSRNLTPTTAASAARTRPPAGGPPSSGRRLFRSSGPAAALARRAGLEATAQELRLRGYAVLRLSPDEESVVRHAGAEAAAELAESRRVAASDKEAALGAAAAAAAEVQAAELKAAV